MNSTFRRVNWLMVVVFLFGLVFGSFVVIQTAPKAKATTTPTFTTFNIPTARSIPYEITTDREENIWFTEMLQPNIGEVSLSGKVTEYSIPGGWLTGITSGPDDNIWYDDSRTNSIGRITHQGIISEFSIATQNSDPSGITLGTDGNLWFCEYGGSKIGKITSSGKITEFSLPNKNSNPENIVVGKDGNLWFAEQTNNSIGKITTSGVITEYNMPTSGTPYTYQPESLTLGSDGNIWFIGASSSVSRITVDGKITPFIGPSFGNGGLPNAITSGPDGNLWFIDQSTAMLAKMTLTGSITEYSVGSISTNDGFVDGITSDTNGNIWFAEHGKNVIERVNIAPPALVKPTGKWITPEKFNISAKVKTTFTMQASASPSKSGNPGIAHVNFLANWPGHGAVDICKDVTKPISGNTYQCKTDWSTLNGGIPVPQGNLTITFNVTDKNGNVANAPDGSRTGVISSPLLNVSYIDQFQMQNASTKAYDCGPTSVAMALYYTHRIATLDGNAIVGVRKATGKLSSYTNTEQLDTALNTSPYKEPHTLLSSSTDTSKEIASMVAALKQGHPAVVLIDASVKSPKGLNRGYKGHYFLLVGVSPDGKTVYINDPDDEVSPVGINGGQNMSMTLTAFKASIDAGKQYDSNGSNIIIVS